MDGAVRTIRRNPQQLETWCLLVIWLRIFVFGCGASSVVCGRGLVAWVVAWEGFWLIISICGSGSKGKILVNIVLGPSVS